ncbi:hypothetical protein RJT34_10753 [Clitoria ternatea]|uniref:Uncharacterized protein n=1 Tax=Clitoria ternatea TaxID=43366 RepID=A0AAN9JKK9_CLITE
MHFSTTLDTNICNFMIWRFYFANWLVSWFYSIGPLGISIIGSFPVEPVATEDLVELSEIVKQNLGQTRRIRSFSDVDNSPESLLVFSGNYNISLDLTVWCGRTCLALSYAISKFCFVFSSCICP